MKKKILSILVMFTIIVVSAIPTMGLNVSAANGVQTKINELLAVYPTGSYFTTTGKPHYMLDPSICSSDCGVCQLQNQNPNKLGGLPAGYETGMSGWQCWAFANYAFYHIFGYYGRSFESCPKVNLANAKLGDIVSFTLSGYPHYGVYLYTSGSNVVVYDCNGDYYCGVRYGSSYSASAVNAVYRAPNYDEVNGSSSSPSTYYENITPGTYAIKNNYTGTYMCVSYGYDKNLQNVDMYSEINAASRMVISKASTGYKIRPECCASRLINPYGYSVTSGLNVNIYDDENDSTQWWQFEKVSGGYVIRNVQNPNCVLDTDGGNVFVSSYTGASTQIWSLISTHVHSYGSWKVRKAATCTSNGTDYRTCSCGAEETRTTTALGHNYTSVITKPTCTKGGYTTYTCSRCNNSYTGNNTSATGHSYSSWKVRNAATCTSNGTDYRTCSCGAEETRTTTALGHNYTSITTEPTCTSGGYTTYTCSRCYNSYTDNNTSAIGHSYGSWEVREAATCTANGTDYRTCGCGVEETRTSLSTGHQMSSWIQIKAPTCDVNGIETRNCSKCSYSETREIAALITNPSDNSTDNSSDDVFGDIDDDGDVDAADYILVKRAVLKTYELTEQQKLVADVDADGDIDATDYVLVKRIVLGTYKVK